MERMTTSLPIPSLETQGRVIARYSARADVETATGNTISCTLRQNLGPVVTGDHVRIALPEQVITTVLPRTSALSRFDEQGRSKLIAANVDQLVIVVALEPAYSMEHIDAYLIFSELHGIKPLIVLNKMDLCPQPQPEALTEWMTLYQRLNYSIIETQINNDLILLEQALHHHCSIFVGQSGVGKSSLLSRLLPEQNIKIGDFNPTIGHGNHTTSTSRLYHLLDHAEVIDSPGIRELQLGPLNLQDLMQGFIEFHPYLNQCKFRNCQHKNEPECAIIKAIEQGNIHAHRFEYYHYLLAKNL